MKSFGVVVRSLHYFLIFCTYVAFSVNMCKHIVYNYRYYYSNIILCEHFIVSISPLPEIYSYITS